MTIRSEAQRAADARYAEKRAAAERSESQREADARYAAKQRGKPPSEAQKAASVRFAAKQRGQVASVVWRMTPGQAEWLETQREPGESRASAVARLLGVQDK